MEKFTHLSKFLSYLFVDDQSVRKAQAITAGYSSGSFGFQ